MLYLANAFSLNMIDFDLDIGRSPEVQFVPVSHAKAVGLLTKEGFVSAVGHADTAAVISNILDLTVRANRVSIKLGVGDTLIVAQFTGPRLTEGTTTLPEGATLTFISCTISYW